MSNQFDVSCFGALKKRDEEEEDDEDDEKEARVEKVT